jgi:hypothetical protein
MDLLATGLLLYFQKPHGSYNKIAFFMNAPP